MDDMIKSSIEILKKVDDKFMIKQINRTTKFFLKSLNR